jgi:murein DD-endopeptidase MepM/ murein hydrolase activator NlpD
MKLSKKQKIGVFIPLFIGGGLLIYALILGVPPTFNPPSLEFPILEDNNIFSISAYGIENWSGPGTHHNGIDLVINTSVTIVSPVEGTVIAINERQNMQSEIQNILFEIKININGGWNVNLVLEPNFPGVDVDNNTLQRESIQVSLFQRLDVGTQIATLLNSGYYSHLHYMLEGFSGDVCPYTYSSDQAKSIFNALALRTNQSICM